MCHYGSSFSPPPLKPGETTQGSDGQTWAFTGRSEDHRCAVFKVDEPLSHQPARIAKTPARKSKAALGPACPVLLDASSIELATHEDQIPEAPQRLPDGKPLDYSSTQKVVCRVKADGSKSFFAKHLVDGEWIKGAGSDAWPWFKQNEALTVAEGKWLLELEGEKCCWHAWQRLSCAAITHPGHNLKPEQKKARYKTLKQAGVNGVLYLADNDEQGLRKAESCQKAALAVDLPFAWAKATDVWGELPDGGSIDDAKGTPEELKAQLDALIDDGSCLRYDGSASDDIDKSEDDGSLALGNGQRSAPHRLLVHEIREHLPRFIGGTPTHNIRSGDFLVGDRIYSADDIDLLYLQLSNDERSWVKQSTADSFLWHAKQNAFDPVERYLSSVAKDAEAVPDDVWDHLDIHLLGIEDQLAAKVLKDYLMMAVARVFEPGCPGRMTPVLIGAQGRGKTTLGEALFGEEFFVSGLSDLGKDDLLRCQSAWAVELAELDGVTRRSDQEHLKAFLTAKIDDFRKPYGKGSQRYPRRFVFWGTSNGSPFRDTTGSTRFVAIDIPDQYLPIDWVKAHRDNLWARAVDEYRKTKGTHPWDKVSEEEREERRLRNERHEAEDAWEAPTREYLEQRRETGRLPIQTGESMEVLEIPQSARSNANTARISGICKQLGWERMQKRQAGGKRRQGWWPSTPATPGNTDVNSETPQSWQCDCPDGNTGNTTSKSFVERGIEQGFGSEIIQERLNKTFSTSVLPGSSKPESDSTAVVLSVNTALLTEASALLTEACEGRPFLPKKTLNNSFDFEAAVIKVARQLEENGEEATSVGVLNGFRSIAKNGDPTDPLCDAYLGHVLQGPAAINKALKTNKHFFNGDASND